MTVNCRSKNIAEVLGRWGAGVLACVVLGASIPVLAQAQKPATPAQPAPTAAAASLARPTDPAVPPGYVIGADDLLEIVFWKDKDMSAEARVRPDGRIALPLINEVVAAGLTAQRAPAAASEPDQSSDEARAVQSETKPTRTVRCNRDKRSEHEFYRRNLLSRARHPCPGLAAKWRWVSSHLDDAPPPPATGCRLFAG